jgi:hypothetical protein
LAVSCVGREVPEERKMLKAIAAMIGFKTVQKITEGGADQQFVFHHYEDIWLMIVLFFIALLALWGLGRLQKRSVTK